jgi:hypothetical protein
MATAAEIEDLMTGPLVTWVCICVKLAVRSNTGHYMTVYGQCKRRCEMECSGIDSCIQSLINIPIQKYFKA